MEDTFTVKVVEGVTKNTFLQDIYPLGVTRGDFSYTTHKKLRITMRKQRKPAVLKGYDIGVCQSKWRVDYLCQAGGNKDVKIHVSPVPQMDFISKNFIYRTLPFNELVRRASSKVQKDYFINEHELYYLRALGDDSRKEVADINKQFPTLANDINIPDFFSTDKFFSSVFRIGSAGVQLWTHYDVMDNLLIQVSGRKRVVLFPPSDVDKLYMKGDKSTVLDIDTWDRDRFSLFSQVTRYECYLDSGDILFIPALWFHNVISLDFGVAVNVFWKHLSNDKYDPRDIYGNKDPLPASRAQQIVDRAVKVLEELPAEYREFYGKCLATRLCYKTATSVENMNT